MIDWSSGESHFLLNPKLPTAWLERLEAVKKELPQLPGHIWILSSGTSSTQSRKWMALSKKAFLASAKAVNQILDANNDDIWLRVLPDFHVGGLSIEARCFLSGAKYVDEVSKWSAANIYHKILLEKVTLLSLVPTQLHDLVQLGKSAPETLRAVIIGGGSLSPHLMNEALRLGYPVLPSYGMTECCSQIATGLVDQQDGKLFMRLLDHVHVRANEKGLLEVRSEALMSGYAVIDMQTSVYHHIPEDSWYQTEDIVNLREIVVDKIVVPSIAILGRQNEVIKVSGELVSLQSLRNLLDACGFSGGSTVLSVSDERLENRLIHVYLKSFLNESFEKNFKKFCAQVLPFEKPKEIYFVDEIPRSELDKVRVGELLTHLGY